MVEVDVSTIGVGMVLSQWQGTPPKRYPCAFFSLKLSATEQNYDIGIWELLVIKLVLEKGRHFLRIPFIPRITDHWNLEYLCETKRLNGPCTRHDTSHDGPCFSPTSTSRLHTIQVPKNKKQKPVPCLRFTPLSQPAPLPNLLPS